MSVVDIEFAIFHADDPYSPISSANELTFANPWAGLPDHGQAAAAHAAEAYLTDRIWADEFGAEETTADVLLQIIAPAVNAGFYRVELRRPIKASARPRLEKDPRHG